MKRVDSLLRVSRRLLEKSHGDNTKDETADMSRVRHPAACLFADGAEIHKLNQEPDTDEKGCGYVYPR
jgi:hypothetical protein